MQRDSGDVHDPTVFERLVAEALDEIPGEFARHLQNVAVVVEEEPSPALLRSVGLHPRRDTLLGLYEGIPLTARPYDFAGHPPDRITLFRQPLLEAASTPSALRRQIRITIVHEIAHFFGLDDARIRRLGY